MSKKSSQGRRKQRQSAQMRRQQQVAQREEREATPVKRKTGMEIAVIIVAVVMVVSILLPSFAQIFASQTTSTNSQPQTLDEANDQYSQLVAEYQSQLDSNPDDATAQLNLANSYFQWGSYARLYATQSVNATGEDDEAKEYFENAITYYSEYLNQQDGLSSNEVKAAAVAEALSEFYLDNTQQAIDQLTEVAHETDYAPAWANLGMVYESEGNTENARSAYQKAIDADPNNAMGTKTYAENRLSQLNSSAAQSTGGAAGLAEKLDSTDTSVETGDSAATTTTVG